MGCTDSKPATRYYPTRAHRSVTKTNPTKGTARTYTFGGQPHHSPDSSDGSGWDVATASSSENSEDNDNQRNHRGSHKPQKSTSRHAGGGGDSRRSSRPSKAGRYVPLPMDMTEQERKRSLSLPENYRSETFDKLGYFSVELQRYEFPQSLESSVVLPSSYNASPTDLAPWSVKTKRTETNHRLNNDNNNNNQHHNSKTQQPRSSHHRERRRGVGSPTTPPNNPSTLPRTDRGTRGRVSFAEASFEFPGDDDDDDDPLSKSSPSTSQHPGSHRHKPRTHQYPLMKKFAPQH